MTATATAAPRRRAPHFSPGSVKPIPAALLKLAPKPLHGPNDEYAAALAALATAGNELRETEDNLRRAEHADAKAAEQAVDEGREVPAPMTAGPRAQIADARRKFDAAEAVATRRHHVYLDALTAVHAEFAAAADAELEKAAKTLDGYITAIASAVTEAKELKQLRRQLGNGDDLRGRNPSFTPGLNAKHRAHLPEPVRDALSTLKAAV